MKPISKIAVIFLIIACFATEVWLMRTYKADMMPFAVVSALIAVFFLSVVWCVDKQYLLFVTILNAFKAGLAGILGLLLILFTALHIGWLGTCITNYTDNNGSLYEALFVLSIFCIPFFIMPLFYPREREEEEVSPEVLISSLSKNEKATIQEFIGTGKLPWNWQPSVNVLKGNSSIHTMYLLASEGTAAAFEGLQTDGYRELELYRLMLQQQGLQHVNLIILKVINPNNLVDYKRDLENKLAGVLNNKQYPDEKLLFDITGGTVISSVVMILLAYKGKRRAVYQQQDGNKDLEIINPDTQNFKELWQQILEGL